MNFAVSAKAAVAVPGLGIPLIWTPHKESTGRLAATALVGNASHPKVHDTL